MAGNAPTKSTWTQNIPGPYVDIELLGDSRQVDNMLRSLYGAFEDDNIGHDFLEDYVDPILRKTTEERFRSEGDATTGPWAPLAAATVAIRESKGFGGEHPINVRAGSMVRHLLYDPPKVSTHSLGATMWSPGTPGTKKVQDKVRTAQQGGTTPEGRPVPARPVLGVGPQDLEAVMIALTQYLAKHVANGGAEVNWL